MKNGIYRKLAWTGITKNSKLYIPYILTCAGSVMMCYIISFLSVSPTFASVKGGETVQSFLQMGFSVMAVFSLIFLFYTNSFLTRRRKKEFGLYNILGLGKKHLAKVMLIETLIIAGITVSGGLFFGILLSKFAELFMVEILNGNITYTFSVDISSAVKTLVLFLVIFLLLFLNTMRQIHLTNPIQLLNSEHTGEKPPKANWIAAILGTVILAAAYYMAVTIDNPVAAISFFFLAVVMVIVATYLLFIAGSVTLCRILQKNKRYYYKTNHFVSVSSMVYRMKRNGAGLASICILCTMVLVMVSSTVCLYIGAEDSLRNRYPRNINLDVLVNESEFFSDEQTVQAKQLINEVVEENNSEQKSVLEYRTLAFAGMLNGNKIDLDPEAYNTSINMSDIYQVFIVSVSDYNRLMNKNETVSSQEAILYVTKDVEYINSTIQIGECDALKVIKQVDDFADNGVDSMQIFPTMYLFVSDIDTIFQPLKPYAEKNGGEGLLSLHWYYGFDLSCNDETQINIQDQISEKIDLMKQNMGENSLFHFSIEGVAKERADFYGIYAGLFFLGIFLGSVFIFAAVLIIYYK